MEKVILKDVQVRNFKQLLKRASSYDNMIFINLKGSELEATSYNRNKSALKLVSANLEKLCDEFSNPIDDTVKIQIANASKLITTLDLVGDESLNIIFEVEEDNYTKRIILKNNEMNITINCADKEAVSFLDIPEEAREKIFNDLSKLQISVNIPENEFKKIKGLIGLNKDSVRVFFNLVNGNEIIVSEIESTDENVRQEVNEIINENNYDAFNKFDKLYDKKLLTTEFEKSENVDNYLACFNKQYFDWIDLDKNYVIEFHSNKIKFISFDDDNDVKTYVVLTPVRFA